MLEISLVPRDVESRDLRARVFSNGWKYDFAIWASQVPTRRGYLGEEHVKRFSGCAKVPNQVHALSVAQGPKNAPKYFLNNVFGARPEVTQGTFERPRKIQKTCGKGGDPKMQGQKTRNQGPKYQGNKAQGNQLQRQQVSSSRNRFPFSLGNWAICEKNLKWPIINHICLTGMATPAQVSQHLANSRLDVGNILPIFSQELSQPHARMFLQALMSWLATWHPMQEEKLVEVGCRRLCCTMLKVEARPPKEKQCQDCQWSDESVQ